MSNVEATLSDEEAGALLDAAKSLVREAKIAAAMISPRNAPLTAISIMTAATGILVAELALSNGEAIALLSQIASHQIRNAAEGWAEEVMGA